MSREQVIEDVLRRILAWDHLPETADGPYWVKEILAALSAPPAPTRRLCDATGRPWSDPELLLLDHASRTGDTRYQDAAMALHAPVEPPAPMPEIQVGDRLTLDSGHERSVDDGETLARFQGSPIVVEIARTIWRRADRKEPTA